MRTIVAPLDDHTFDQASAVAAHVSAKPKTVALIATSDATGVRLVCARSADLPAANAAAILKRATTQLGGKAA